MKYELFQYALPYDGDLSDLNRFLSSHRVVAVTQSIVRAETNPVLTFVVEYLDSVIAGPKRNQNERVDYKQKLSTEDFALFSLLRDERKRLAVEAGVPVYTILTNAQLAEMVEQKVTTIEKFANLSGIGKGRTDKFGLALVEVITKFHSSSKEVDK